MNGVLKLLFMAVTSVAVQVVNAQSGPAERPSLKPGSEWVYKVDDSKRARSQPVYDLKRVIKDVSASEYAYDLVLPTGTRTTYMSLDLNPASEGMTSRDKAQGVLPYFSFPLEPGKTWSGSVTYPAPFGGGGIRVTMTGKALDWEEVTVPAGKFRAIKVEATGGSSFGSRKVVLWYAPEVSNFVRMEWEMSYGPNPGKSIHELASFSLK